jgi:hypothetical protein
MYTRAATPRNVRSIPRPGFGTLARLRREPALAVPIALTAG